MMKTLKMGLLGLALGVGGALVLPSTEAVAQTGGGIPDSGSASPGTGISSQACCSTCNPNYSACINNAGGNPVIIAACTAVRAACESSCYRTC
jgi:hypothetical protein